MELKRKIDRLTGTAGGRLGLAFGLLTAMLLLLAAFVAYESYKISSVDLQRQQQASNLARYADQLEIDLLNMETGKRGYLLTGDESFLEPYERGRRQFEQELEEARRINQGEGATLVAPGTLDELEGEYDDIVTLFEDQIQTRREGVTGSEDLQLSRGKDEVDRARETLGRMDDQALASRGDARRRTESALRNEVLSAGGLGLLALLIGLAAVLFVRRGLVYPLQRLRDEALATAGRVREHNRTDAFEVWTGPLESGGWSDPVAGTTASAGTREIKEVGRAFGDLLGELRLQTERVRSLVAGIEDLLVTVDLGGHITYLNAAAARLTGFDPREVAGWDLSDLVSEPDGPTSSIHRAMAAREPVSSAQESLRRRDGAEIPVSSTSSPLLGEDGSVIGGLKIMHDLTESKRAQEEQRRAREAAEAADRAKSEFLANMSHEIRTPMNGVIGMTDLLMGTPLSAEQREYAEIIRGSGEALLAVINDILDFSKIEAGRIELETEDFDLRKTVEEVTQLFAAPARDKGLELAGFVEPGTPTALEGDAFRIRQVLTNLVGNAVKFTESGEVILHASVSEQASKAATIRFEVTDTGIGMTAEQQTRLFEAFSQAEVSTTRRYGGTGLGLAISKSLVELMGGELGATSEPGTGSTFHFTVRLAKQAAGRIPAVTPRTDLGGLRVLVVDGNATNREILRHQLDSWGMHNAAAEDGPRALQMLRKAAGCGEPYELALLDMTMPGMDGIALARVVCSEPAISDIRMVLLTSLGEGLREEARQAGISEQLTKPIRQSRLYDAMARVMGHGPREESSEETLDQETPEAPRKAGAHAIRPVLEGVSIEANRVLVAEDNPVNQRVAVRMLENLGYNADIVENGQEALAALLRANYGAVLMDVQMPEMDGYEATAEIRKSEGIERHTPIIAMTANAMAGDREKVISAGMDDYVPKPIKTEQLGEALSRWVGTDASASPETLGAPDAGATLAAVALDRAVLKNLRELGEGEELLQEMVDAFLEDSCGRLEDLRDSLPSGDTERLMQTAHAFKGSAATMGAAPLARACAHAEESARGGDLSQLRQSLDEIENRFSEAREALLAELID